MAFSDDVVLASLDYFEVLGGYYDCEILFNVDRDRGAIGGILTDDST